MINDSRTNNTNHLVQAINNQYFEINDLKVQLQDKIHVINELKHQLAQFHGKSPTTQCESPNFDSMIQEIKDENVSLAFQVSSLVKEGENNKLEYKKLYDSIKQTQAKTKLQTDSFVNTKLSKPPTLGTKLYSITSLPKSKNNKVVHQDYLNVTKENVATLQELLEEAGALKPLDVHIGYAFKFTERIQELLVKVNLVGIKCSSSSKSTLVIPPRKIITTTVILVVEPCPKHSLRYANARESLSRSYLKLEIHPFNLYDYGIERILSNGTSTLEIVEIFLWYLDSGCSKHMPGHLDKLINFVSKFIGLGHNLFSIWQFCDLYLEVAFRKHTCLVRNLDGVDLLLGSHGSKLYTISMADMIKSSPIFLLFKACRICDVSYLTIK
ncbi:hypothetical protein Tco_1003586 [Tanacetum coccineum]|uniref:Integrase, catalytic region, zinc finger, CCHC-type, peptidase aspartic, catalytic n=1 Tax=Tanacetum coccineum TaxID=301880 RepID=A0ABQ5FAW2_9ASTR